jgi:cytochrome b561
MSGEVRYNSVAMIIHWLIALTVIGLIVIGYIMTDLPRGDPTKLTLYNLHKSFGVTVFLLTLVRLGWRLTHKAPALPDAMPSWEKRVAHITHWLFYGLLLGVPVLGWIMVSGAPRNIPTVLFGTVVLPHLPGLVDMGQQTKKDYKELFETAHAAAAYVMAGLIVLHVGAALRHWLLLKDKVLQRMLPKFIPVLAAGLLFALPATAADWSVDTAKSDLGFTGTLSGKGFEGHFKSWQAEISFDPANPAGGHAKVTIDMASAVTGDRQRDNALPESDWFDVKKMPQATFEATGFTAKGGNQFEAAGFLTIRGVKKPVTLPFTLDISGTTAHAKGKLDIVRTDYGVGQGEWTDGAYVALNVGIVFDLTAAKKP